MALSKRELMHSRFRAHAEKWHEATGGYSAPAQIVSNDDYLSVVAMGADALPFILEDLASRGGYWYPALKAITGESVFDEAARGRPRLMTAAWLSWGRERGLIS